jgi:hypothetical protein
MIRVRDDDVLLSSSMWDKRRGSFDRFSRVHRWISEFPQSFIHVPTILVTEIQAYPECIEFVREQTAQGLMIPEIHGLEHIDYGKLTAKEVESHLGQCIDWFDKNLQWEPTKFYTPWGGMSQAIAEGATACGLTAHGVDLRHTLESYTKRLGAGEPISILEGNEVFMHWWNKGIRLKRVAMAVKHGSWQAAAEAPDSKEYF